jgi:molybdopterin-guanine dinucleotide biosynthesis protein A
VLTVPADTPFLPRDLVTRLSAAGTPALARSGGRIHPVVGLWPLALRDDLRRSLREAGVRKVEAWTGRLDPAIVDFEAGAIDPFFNINTPEDLTRAEALL